MPNIYIARQPIYDSNLEIKAFELLYRDSEVNSASFSDASQASSETIVNAFIHIGIDNLVGTALAFVNFPSEFILNNDLITMFQEQSVLEVLEDVEPSVKVIEGIKNLKAKGYKVALDDFVYSEKMKPMLALADFVKIDVIDYDADKLSALIALLKQDYSFKLIAEKVETQDMFQQCQQLGFDYFQGYFFCRPQLVSQKNASSNKAVALNLLSQLQNPDTHIDELEIILAQDVTLTYKLLRYINSAAFSLRREIESVKQAIVLLGLDAVKNWISLILMSRIVDDKPDQLIVTALVRAKMSQLIAKKVNPNIEKQIFICGLFSVLDALMDKSMVDLLDSVILSTPIKLALLDYDGELGELLFNCILYERAEFEELEKRKINTEYYYDAYIAAIKWADESMRQIKN
ncbi:MAG: HDOD domain-containing protein [Gammaproteobacteria bacterium]|nr:HDOD domain-containing protein [Gammaproteobacteria bacterium]